MAQHRRVVPRGIVGTGMATDAERIRDLHVEKERRERAWREPPARAFDDVLAHAPSQGELVDEPAPKTPSRTLANTSEDVGEEADEESPGQQGRQQEGETPPEGGQRDGSGNARPRAFDPREAALRRQLEARLSSAVSAPSAPVSPAPVASAPALGAGPPATARRTP